MHGFAKKIMGLGLLSVAMGDGPALQVREEKNLMILDNGELRVSVDRASAKVRSLKFHQRELLDRDGAYWSLSGNSGMQRLSHMGKVVSARVSCSPATGKGDYAELAFDLEGSPAQGGWPLQSSLHFGLTKGGDALMIYAICDHTASAPGMQLGEGRFVAKLNGEVFDAISIDAQRRGPVPAGRDWDRGEQMNLKEVRRIVTGPFAGKVEHKYGYSALHAQLPAYGWYSSRENIGFWMINGSAEYLSGGPTKVELTAHLDVNAGGVPTLLNMWHGSHYGGSRLILGKNDPWQRCIGPFFLHVNQAASPALLVQNAEKRAEQLKQGWPYPGLIDARIGGVPRCEVKGSLRCQDDLQPNLRRGTLWVGLTAEDEVVVGRRSREVVTWERDGRHYQYWTKADASGHFVLPHVRPGRYVLRAFADGILGEMAQLGVTVERNLDLGERVWQIARAGKTLWEIGVPDRSAAEFRHGDTYWKWGQYYQYSKDFPQGVFFQIGKSDPRQDWNYAQPPLLDSRGNVVGNSTWRVGFELAELPPNDPVLRVSLCAFRAGGQLNLGVNGKVFANSGRFAENGVMHRDGIRGNCREFRFVVPRGLLKVGSNVLSFESEAWSWHQAVMYDYLRLEEGGASSVR